MDRSRAGSDAMRTLGDQPTGRVEHLKDLLFVLPTELMDYYGESGDR